MPEDYQKILSPSYHALKPLTVPQPSPASHLAKYLGTETIALLKRGGQLLESHVIV